MDFIGVVIVLAIGWWLKSAINDLKRRLAASEMGVADLRRQLTDLQRRVGSQAAPPEAPAAPPQTEPQPTPVEDATRAEPPSATPPPSSVPPVAQSTWTSSTGTAQPDSNQPGLEERLGTRWAVWVGAFALALGGLLLVRYSIENNLVGPGLRLFFGAVLAAGLAAAGEIMRRRERAFDLPIIPAAHIPSALTGAGTVVALGTTYAAHAVYEFIGPAPAFGLLGAISLSAIAAAALHGPVLAGVGLLGGLAAPLLVASGEPNPWPVVIYLGVVSAAAYSLARLRRWLWLAAGTIVGAVVWSMPLLLASHQAPASAGTVAMVHILVQLALAAFFVGIEPHLDAPDEDSVPDLIGLMGLLALSGAALIATIAEPGGAPRAVSFALIAIGILATAGSMSAPVAAAMLFAAVLAAGVLVDWGGVTVPHESLPVYLRSIEASIQPPDAVGQFLRFAAFVPLSISALAVWRLFRGPQLPATTAGLYAPAATLPPLLAFVIAYLRITQFDQSIRFAAAGAVLALIFAVGAEAFLRAEARERTAARALGTGALAAAAIAALSFAMTCALDRGYLTVAFAIAALGTSFIAVRRDIPLLRYAVVALGVVVLCRVFYDPRIMGTDVGKWPILNWLLFGYGVPAVCFALAARILNTRTDDISVRLSDALSVVFAALLVSYQIRHLLYGGDPLHAGSGHVEFGLQTTASLGFAYVLARLDLARANPIFRAASILFGVIGAAAAFIGLGIAENPLFERQAIVGRPWFSSLALAYLLPGVMAVLLARASRSTRPVWFVNMTATLAVLLLLAFVTLEVRHTFQGPLIMIWRKTGGAEHWAYSAAWLFLGIAFLAYGVLLRSKPARLASAGLVLLAVLKVFLFDLQGLTGLWRALSFITLGLVLIGIGLVYQRLLFQPRSTAPSAEPAQS